jgi:hypothetical protein
LGPGKWCLDDREKGFDRPSKSVPLIGWSNEERWSTGGAELIIMDKFKLAARE